MIRTLPLLLDKLSVSIQDVLPIFAETFPLADDACAYAVVATSISPAAEYAAIGALRRFVEISPVAVRAMKPTSAGTRTRNSISVSFAFVFISRPDSPGSQVFGGAPAGVG